MNNEVWMWVHLKYGISRIVWNFNSNKTDNWSYLSFLDYGRLNWKDNEWEWCSINVSASKIWNESNRTRILFNQNKQLILPCCYRLWSIESKKQWILWIKYECDCIINMKRVESYENFIRSKQTTVLTLLLPTMVYWILF